MQGQDAPWRNLSHHLHQVGKVGVVAEGERGVGLVAEPAAGVQCPTGEDGDAARTQATSEGWNGGAGGREDDMPSGTLVDEEGVRWEGLAQLFVNAGQASHGLGQHDGQALGGECGQHFLGFAERVTQQDGDLVVVKGVATEQHDGLENVRRGRKDVLGPTEGGFHDEDVGVPGRAWLGREPAAQLEVAGIEQGLAVGPEPCHGGAQDMSGGQKRQVRVAPGPLPCLAEAHILVEGQDMLGAFTRDAGAHEASGGLGEEHLGVRPRVVRMGMGHDDRLARADGLVRVHPKAQGGKMESATLHPKVQCAHAEG